MATEQMQASNSTVNKIGQNLTKLTDNRVIRMHNITCPYCGHVLTSDVSTKEHAISRRLVPKGKLHGCWNLVVNACRKCNGIKSELEDDISAITLQPDVFGRYGHEDELAVADGKRKAKKSFSRRTKRSVKDSHEVISIKRNLGPGAEVTFNITGPPQIDAERVFNLARFQVVAFFYWVTFDKKTKRGRFWDGGFYPLHDANRSDWGNPVQRAFADAVVEWEPRVLAFNADGFYKIALRKHPSATCWSWALEWNHAMRVIGFCGDRNTAQTIAAGFPKLTAEIVSHEPNGSIAYRVETPLPEDEDRLFYWDEGAGR